MNENVTPTGLPKKEALLRMLEETYIVKWG
jgi:hypothetical protein